MPGAKVNFQDNIQPKQKNKTKKKQKDKEEEDTKHQST